MASEFKIASAYVEVGLKDSTSGDEQKIRARLEGAGAIDLKTALQDPDNTRAIKERIEASPAAKIKTKAENPLDAAWRREVEASLRETAKNAVKIPISPETEKFRRDLAAAIEAVGEGLKAEIPADLTEAAKFRREVELLAKMASDETKVRIKAEVDGTSLAKASSQLESETSKMAARANRQFKAKQFAVMFAGLPAAAAIAGAGTVAALSVVPAAFVGMSVAALKNNQQVIGAYSDLKSHVVTDTQQMAGVMKGPLIAAAGDLGASFDRMKPQIQAATSGSVPAVRQLVGAVTDFAEGAMPGMVVAVANSQGPLAGLRTVAGQVGAGVTDMFTNMSKGAASSQQVFGTFGGAAQDLLGSLGNVFANLSNNGNPSLQQFRTILSQVEQGMEGATAAGSPLYGVISGFTSTVSGGLGVLGSFASLLSSLPPGLQQFGGSLLAVNKMAGLFGTSLGQTGFGIGAFATTTDAAGNKTSAFRSAIAGADGVGSKFKAGLSSIVAGGLNPMGLALGIGAIALDEIGRRQQEAAQKTQEHREAVRTLTQALREDNGAVGLHTRSVMDNALQQANAANNAKTFGSSFGELSAAASGNEDALRSVKNRADNLIDSFIKSGAITSTNMGVTKQYTQWLLDNGGAAETGAHDFGNLTEAQRNQVIAMQNAVGAVGNQIKAAREAHDSYVAMETATSGLSSSQVELRDKTTAATQAMYEQQNTSLGYRGALLSTKEAQDAYNKVLKDGKATDDQKTKALLDLERAQAAQTQAAYNNAYANSKAGSDAGKMAEATAAADRELVNMVKSSGHATQSQQELIAKMSASQAATAGFEVAINGAGQAVVRLPDGKEIVIQGNTAQALQALADLKARGDATTATTHVFANADPAKGAVLDWQNTTRSTVGNTTTTTYTDPATRAVTAWRVTTDATGAVTTTMSRTDPATGAVREWKRMADGTWALTEVRADTAAATAAIDYAARNRSMTITVDVRNPGNSGSSNQRGLADGGVIGSDGVQAFANGGINAFDGGGVQAPIRMPTGVAAVAEPRRLRLFGDNPTVPESYIPWNDSKRSKELLALTNREMGNPLGVGNSSVAVAESKVENHYHVTVNGHQLTADEIVDKVVRKLSWATRGR